MEHVYCALTFIVIAIAPNCLTKDTPDIRRVDVNLRKHLFGNSIHTRPIINQSAPIPITLGVEIAQIISVDERTQRIEFKLWTRMSWKNEFVTWDPKNWSNIKSLKVTSEHVWTPDITLYNDIDEKQEAGAEKYNKDIQIKSDGASTWNAPGIFKSICKMDVKYFPFDVQYCVLTFGSWEYNAGELALIKHTSPAVTKKYIKSSEWDLIHVDVNVNTIKYKCCPNPFQDMAFKFVIHRRPLYYVFNVIIPCIILMCLVLFSFFLPPDSGERITIVVTVLLAFTVILQLLNQSMPRNSDSAPVLLIFYAIIMAESTFSLFTTCLVLVAHYKGGERWTTPLPNWVKVCMDKITLPLGVYRSNTRKDFRENKNLPSTGPTYKCLTKLMTDSKIPVADMKKQMENIPNLDYIQHCKLDKVLNELECITTLIQEREIQDQYELEWKHFARVLDRMFFFVILFSFLLSSMGILLPAYFKHKREDVSLDLH